MNNISNKCLMCRVLPPQTVHIKRIREHYKQLWANKCDNLYERDRFLERCNLKNWHTIPSRPSRKAEQTSYVKSRN